MHQQLQFLVCCCFGSPCVTQVLFSSLKMQCSHFVEFTCLCLKVFLCFCLCSGQLTTNVCECFGVCSLCVFKCSNCTVPLILCCSYVSFKVLNLLSRCCQILCSGVQFCLFKRCLLLVFVCFLLCGGQLTTNVCDCCFVCTQSICEFFVCRVPFSLCCCYFPLKVLNISSHCYQISRSGVQCSLFVFLVS